MCLLVFRHINQWIQKVYCQRVLQKYLKVIAHVFQVNAISVSQPHICKQRMADLSFSHKNIANTKKEEFKSQVRIRLVVVLPDRLIFFSTRLAVNNNTPKMQ